MAELIGEASFLTLLGGKRLGIAAKGANAADLHRRWREHLLEAREINLAGRKPLIRDKCRPFRKHDREIGVASLIDRVRQSPPSSAAPTIGVRRSIPRRRERSATW